MKKQILNLNALLIVNCLLAIVNCRAQNIGINTSGNTPDGSAGLDVSFNNKGLLIPRMALTGINDAATIATPANSLLIYHTGSVGLPTAGYYYNSGTSGAPVWTMFSTGSGAGWLTTGNNGTVSGTNFLGTIDNQDLDIRTFNTLKLRVSTKAQLEIFNTTAPDNILIGEGAGETQTTGAGTIFLGKNAGYWSQNAIHTVAIGNEALYNNTVGDYNVSIGSYSMWGSSTNSSGTNNVAVGYYAMYNGPNKTANTAIGYNAMSGNINGNNNVAVGFQALLGTCGDYNTAMGWEALDATTASATFNTAVGKSALGANTDGTYNTAFGANALLTNTTGTNNTAIGNGADVSAVGLTNATAIGNGAIVSASNSLVLGNAANVGIGSASPAFKLDVNGAIRTGQNATDGQLLIYSEQGVTDYTYTINPNVAATQNVVFTLPPDDGAANQVLQTDGAGALTWVAAGGGGDITDVIAGNGLTGGGATGSVTVTAVGDNGLTTNADDIDLGGTLNQATTITQGSNAFTITNNGTANTTVNLSGTGDFSVQDNGTAALFVDDGGQVGINNTVPNRMTWGTSLSVESPTSARVELLKITSSAGELGTLDFVRIAAANGAVTGRATVMGVSENGNDATSLKFHTMAPAGMLEPAKMIITGTGNVGIGTTVPTALLTAGVNLTGTAASTTFKTNAGALGTTAANELALASIGFTSSNSSSLGIRAYRTANGSDWTTTAIGLGMDVDNTVRAGASLWLNANGFVGIGTSNPTYKLDVTGNLNVCGNISYTSVSAGCSDVRYKKDITPLPNALNSVMQIQGVNYFWKTKDFPDKHFTQDKQIGFIAQEMEKVYPELVVTDKDGYKSVDYSRLTPVLVEAIKEQQEEINNYKLQIANLQSAVNSQQTSITILQTSNIEQDARIKKMEEIIGLKSEK